MNNNQTAHIPKGISKKESLWFFKITGIYFWIAAVIAILPTDEGWFTSIMFAFICAILGTNSFLLQKGFVSSMVLYLLFLSSNKPMTLIVLTFAVVSRKILKGYYLSPSFALVVAFTIIIFINLFY